MPCHDRAILVPACQATRAWRWCGTLLCGVLLLAGCAVPPVQHHWEGRLRGDAIVMLGEVHDNPQHHQQRLAVLQRAFAAGWRPALVLEQFDREKQTDIERARRERPDDAQHVIDLAAPARTAAGGWDWNFYRPFVALALAHNVPLIAGNLSSADTARVVRGGYAAVFDAAMQKALTLDVAVPAAMQTAQEREIDEGHCKALPPKLLPAMARGQMARDAVMASIVATNAANGAVLIAGNGHVRRDIGVAKWLRTDQRSRVLTVGYLEQGGSAVPDAAFDAVVRTAAAQRDDPCLQFKRPG